VGRDDAGDGRRQIEEKRVERSEWARAPDSGRKRGVVDRRDDERKARGIYTARLYTARVKARGRIVVTEQFGNGESGRIRWSAARFVLGVADPRGIRSVAALSIGGQQVEFRPRNGRSSPVAPEYSRCSETFSGQAGHAGL
jgi:inner membrane protein involved in colicin E2 resistance